MTEQTRHKLAREAIDQEIAHARAGRNHPSVRVVTLERVLAIADAKTEALKAIHRICNRLLDDNELTDLDIPLLVRRMRGIASATWPAIAPRPAPETAPASEGLALAGRPAPATGEEAECPHFNLNAVGECLDCGKQLTFLGEAFAAPHSAGRPTHEGGIDR